MKSLRTPAERFVGLPDYPFAENFVEVDDLEGGSLRVHYVDEGPRDADPIVLLHGEPTWSFLYRHMITRLAAAGHRVIAPDLVGFGRSDKPSHPADYSYRNHVLWMTAWLEAMDLRQVTLFCQDWGSLIGLRMLTAAPDRFARAILANGGLPTGTGRSVPSAFKVWRAFARWSPWFPIGRIVATGCATALSPAEVAAYDAPFPTRRHRLAARLFPRFVPAEPDNPEREANEAAWRVLEHWNKPFLTLFSTRDPITRGGERAFQQRVPGAAGQPHTAIRGAGHFLQEDKGAELARHINAFMAT